MKNIFLYLFISSSTIVASAQDKGAATNSSNQQVKEDIGTTIYGLPVHRSYVAPDVVERAKKKYGRSLYSIEKSAAENCQESYLVGLIQKGKLTMEWMCDDPKLVLHRERGRLKSVGVMD